MLSPHQTGSVPLTFAESQPEIARLVKQFRTNLNHYRAPTYKEAQARQDLIDPLFEALGWDVHNRQGTAPMYKEVLVEESLDIEGHQKAADYTFRVGRDPIFYVEAKRPGISIKTAPEHAYQVRRYAWNTGLPLSILTDFEEFAIYEGRVRPNLTDKVSVARVNFYTYEEYADRWGEIWNVFSREAVLSGSFQQYAEAVKGKRGTSEVDAEFLKDISSWREVLAKNLALRNDALSVEELNDAVQRTLDRLIFLRIAEDRKIEPYERLRQQAAGGDVYAGLIDLFRAADRRFNSGLFDFTKGGDRWMLDLSIDDKVLKSIIDELYYPNSPYRFNDIPVEILGNVYEQFLGKVIRLTAGHQAKVEDKPAVKKAGGVYYTPAYIVEYIVKQTVGKQVEGKSPKQLEGFRVLDMACGSGSFLLGAYQYMLDYYLQWYIEHLDLTGGAKAVVARRDAVLHLSGLGEWRLTVAEKKRILLAHLYGVDIDRQAVEVSKLSLLLKVLEGENDESLQLRLFDNGERALPDLDNNIKCGNSLIGPDYFADQLLPDDDEMKRVNPFDWAREFPEAMRAGGFDCIIGNPPYGATLSKTVKVYLSDKYPFVADFETAQYFLGKTEELAKRAGYVSFIVPNTLLLNLFAKKFRQFLTSTFRIERLANLSDLDVFEGATIRTTIPFLIKDKLTQSNVELINFLSPTSFSNLGSLDQEQLVHDDKAWYEWISNTKDTPLRARVLATTIPLGDVLRVSQGLIPYDKYRGHDEYTIKNRIWHADRRKDKTYKRELRGGDITRYFVQWNEKQWISYGPWLAAPRKPEFFTEPRLLFREITDPKLGLLYVAYTDEEYYNNPGIINCISRGTPYSLLYVLGIAASRLVAYMHYNSSPKAKKGVFPKILVNDVRNLPIHAIDFTSAADKAAHDRMVKLVDTMLQLHPRLAAAKSAHDQALIQRQIDATDRQIDALVYQLYGLTDDEIKIVEGRA